MLLKLWREEVNLAILLPEIELAIGAQLRMLSDHFFFSENHNKCGSSFVIYFSTTMTGSCANAFLLRLFAC